MYKWETEILQLFEQVDKDAFEYIVCREKLICNNCFLNLYESIRRIIRVKCKHRKCVIFFFSAKYIKIKYNTICFVTRYSRALDRTFSNYMETIYH